MVVEKGKIDGVWAALVVYVLGSVRGQRRRSGDRRGRRRPPRGLVGGQEGVWVVVEASACARGARGPLL